MTDRLEIQNQEDEDLKKQLKNIDWTVEYGTITIQLRNGQPTLAKIERTIKLD
uniref:Uncharacterized protein n=1 Tax=viral metagenome TaxID=1070528 RepID=A0A6M3L5C3_9ZZZZ